MQDDTTEVKNTEEVVADEPQTEVTETPVEETSEQPEPETPAEPEEPEPEAPEAQAQEKPISRRESLRVQDLLKKYGPPQAERPTPQPRTNALNYGEALEADPEVIRQLEADRRAAEEASYSQGLKQLESVKWETKLQIDAPRVESEYPILNPKSPEFHPAVADAVNQWFLNMSGYDAQTGTVSNPRIGYGEFVESFMELVQETAGQRQVQSVKNIAKQAATTGLRPDGSSAKRLNLNQPPEKMTTEELYAVLGQRPPKK